MGFSATRALEELKQQLQEVERAVIYGELPTAVISDFKEAVDRIRGNLWAVMQFQADPTQGKRLCVNEVLVQTRLRRAATILRNVISDLETSFVTSETEALEDLHSTLKEALDTIGRAVERSTDP